LTSDLAPDKLGIVIVVSTEAHTMNSNKTCLASLLACLLVLAGAPGFAHGDLVDLIYNPGDGQVRIDTKGQGIVIFSLQNAPGGLSFDFANTDFSDLPTPLLPSDNTETQIGWIAQDLQNGFNGVANLGNIFPAGLSLTQVESFTNIGGTIPPQGRLYGLAPFPPGGGGQMNVVVPEPSSFLFLGLICTGMIGHWSWKKLTTSSSRSD
jgi:hypothetical protein